MRSFELWLDESGNFSDEDIKNRWFDPSKVGGILVESSRVNEKELFEITKDFSHATDDKIPSDIIIKRLQQGKDIGYEYVIFQNITKKKIIGKTDITYLNIMVEGICEVARKLIYEYGEIDLKIYFETRKRMDTDGKIPSIKDIKYDERMQINVMKSNVLSNLKYNLFFVSKRVNGEIVVNTSDVKKRKIYLADYVCNTFHTRNTRKFTEEQKQSINQLFNKEYIFKIYDDPDIERIKDYIYRGQLNEALLEIVTYDGNQSLKNNSDKLLERFSAMSDGERVMNFKRVNNQFYLIVKYIRNNTKNNEYIDRYIKFVKYFNLDNQESKVNLLDIYMIKLEIINHIGDVCAETEVIKDINKILDNTINNEELQKYRNKFAIREATHYINCFRFKKAEQILEKPIEQKEDSLLWIEEACADLQAGLESSDNKCLKSEELAKLYGTRLQAKIPQVYKNNKLFQSALEDSNKSIGRFDKDSDIMRQYQYRSALHCAVGETKKALEMLAKSIGIEKDLSSLTIVQLNDYIMLNLNAEEQKTLNSGVKIFFIMYYTRILATMCLNKQNYAVEFTESFKKGATYKYYKDIVDNNIKVEPYPYNVILWRIGTILYVNGDNNAADKFYKASISLSNMGEQTLKTIGIAVQMEYAALKKDSGMLRQCQLKLADFIKISDKSDINEFVCDWYNRLEELNVSKHTENISILRMSGELGY